MNFIVGSFDLVEYFENTYKCSGFCSEGLFFMSLPLSEGVPTEHCIDSLQEAFKGAKPLTLVLILTAVFALLLFLIQYTLWCKYK